MSDQPETGSVVRMRRSTDQNAAREERHMDDKLGLLKALIDEHSQAQRALQEAERRNAEAYQASTDRRLEHLEKTQGKVLKFAGAVIMLGGVLAFLMFALEWIGPTRLARLLGGGP